MVQWKTEKEGNGTNGMGITAKSIYINDTNIRRENEGVTISSIYERR